MKKLLLAILAIYALSGISYAVNFGIGIKGGVGQNDPKGMKEYWNYYGGTLTKAPGILSLEGLLEIETEGSDWEILDVNKVGIKIGYEKYGRNKLENSSVNGKENTFEIPITFFVKKDQGIKAFSPYIGIGISYFATKIKSSTPSYNFDDYKWFFHIIGGYEYRMTEYLALGIELKYNIDARLEKGYISDRSGLQGLGVVRFYF